MASERHTCDEITFRRYLELFTNVSRTWTGETRVSGRMLPLLNLPSGVFRWDPTLVYTIDSDFKIRVGTGKPLLFIRIMSFDPKYRANHPEIDFCIPMAYDGASETERLLWTLFAGAWSDTRDEAILVLQEDLLNWAESISDRLVVHEHGKDTASIVNIGQRERQGIGGFVRAATNLGPGDNQPE